VYRNPKLLKAVASAKLLKAVRSAGKKAHKRPTPTGVGQARVWG
jgi:hypothetical protein